MHHTKKISFIIALFFIFDNYIETVQKDDLPVAHVNYFLMHEPRAFDDLAPEEQKKIIWFKNNCHPKYGNFVIYVNIVSPDHDDKEYLAKTVYDGYVPVEFFTKMPKIIAIYGKFYKLEFPNLWIGDKKLRKEQLLPIEKLVRIKKMIDALPVLEGF
ncbi:MAG TPA: hypothetical protein VEK38_00020 [Candidatus Bathyarchaeia archaeon]|nr:hypothetical protein [Candidatus Bathyarchaeia archaeon]